MSEPIHEETYKGFTIKIFPDHYPESPREWDNLGTMICWHRRYNLGDKHKYESPEDFKLALAKKLDPSVESTIEYWENKSGYYKDNNEHIQDVIDKTLDKYCIMLPLYLYDHSGITMNTTGFSCRWDSGQVGYIYVSNEKIRKEYSVKKIFPKLREKVCQQLVNEVATYDQYLCGEVYGYVVEGPNGEEDSCWGYFGEDYCIQEAKSVVDHYTKEAA